MHTDIISRYFSRLLLPLSPLHLPPSPSHHPLGAFPPPLLSHAACILPRRAFYRTNRFYPGVNTLAPGFSALRFCPQQLQVASAPTCQRPATARLIRSGWSSLSGIVSMSHRSVLLRASSASVAFLMTLFVIIGKAEEFCGLGRPWFVVP